MRRFRDVGLPIGGVAWIEVETLVEVARWLVLPDMVWLEDSCMVR